MPPWTTFFMRASSGEPLSRSTDFCRLAGKHLTSLIPKPNREKSYLINMVCQNAKCLFWIMCNAASRWSVFERVVVEGMYVTESSPLPITEREMRALLTTALIRSHQAGTTEPYYLYKFLRTNNCVSSAFKILDSVIKYRWFNKIGSMLYRLPLNPRFYLWVRGLDADPSFRKLMRNEFADYIQDDKTQLRKEQLDSTNIAPPL